MSKEEFFKKINTPPYAIGILAFAVVCCLFGWIGWEYLVGSLLLVGIFKVLEIRKNRKP